jgi:hypothetical protein
MARCCQSALGAILLALVLAGCEWFEQPGPRLRRECGSLVDEVLKQDQTVPTAALEAEFRKLPGGTLPDVAPPPQEEDYRPRTGNRDKDLLAWLEWAAKETPPPGSPKAKYLAAMEAYKASVKAKDAKLDELMKQYPEVWNRLFQQRREKAIDECIVNRAEKEGVVNP